MGRSVRRGFPAPQVIETTAALEALCGRLRAEEFVTVDTEFMRERTYWPELCVVQLAGRADVAVVDAMAEGIDLAPLGELLADTRVMKVFHAAKQDIEIFLHRFGSVPAPLFDTQVAAMVAGFGDQVAYDSLVTALAGGTIDKAHRFSDWSARPLTQAQVNYAAADVTYLRTVYAKLRAQLDAEGRLGWMDAEMAALTDPETYRIDPQAMWLRLKPRSRDRRYLGLVRTLAAWREREAQRINIPRQRVLKDESLLEIAATKPEAPEELARTRGLSRGFAEGRMGESLLAAVAEGRVLPEEALPPAPPVGGGYEAVRVSPAVAALLRVLLTAKCEEHRVAPRLVASAEDLDRIALGEDDVEALRGWRREVFGADAIALRGGRVALGVEGARVRLIWTTTPRAGPLPLGEGEIRRN
jgi:ribonuclease D